jgi:phosphoadenosine phosphosulfate reductase
MALFKNNAFAPDDWRGLGPDESLPQGGKVILTLPQWRENRDAILASAMPIGLRLDPGVAVRAIAPDLPRLAIVAIDFPKFSDGRGFSMARQIRSCEGFAGELRALGDILFDQLQYLARCGFTSFEIADPATIRLLAAGRRPGLPIFYQPGLGAEAPEQTRPWARRAAP